MLFYDCLFVYRYTGIIDRNGECHLGIGEMDIFESIDVNLIRNNQSIIEQTQIIVLDGNPPMETMREVIDIAYNRLLPGKFNYILFLNRIKVLY